MTATVSVTYGRRAQLTEAYSPAACDVFTSNVSSTAAMLMFIASCNKGIGISDMQLTSGIVIVTYDFALDNVYLIG
jgi:hypothetical protein